MENEKGSVWAIGNILRLPPMTIPFTEAELHDAVPKQSLGTSDSLNSLQLVLFVTKIPDFISIRAYGTTR
jgi:hypothetical protein